MAQEAPIARSIREFAELVGHPPSTVSDFLKKHPDIGRRTRSGGRVSFWQEDRDRFNERFYRTDNRECAE